MNENKATPSARFGTKTIAEMVAFIALATILHNLKIYQLPNGGAITLGGMVPVLWLSLRRGAVVGTYAGVVFGLVVMVFEPVLVSPLQVLLDYPIAFGALGLAGLFRKWGTIGSIIGVGVGILGRFIAHFLSGVFFFWMYAGSLDPVTYSIIYNGSYLLPELVISVILIFALSAANVLDFGF
jgi:thiamine transporter